MIRNIVLLSLLGMATLGHATNLVVNGSFELYGGSGFPSQIGAGLTGWTITRAGIDIVDEPFWDAADGRTSLSLGWTTPAQIEQIVATTPGQEYDLSYYMAAEIFGGSALRTMDVIWNGTVVDTPSFAYTGQGPNNMGWTQHIVRVVGTGNDVLAFSSTTYSPPNYGPALDHVQLVAVPDPNYVTGTVNLSDYSASPSTKTLTLEIYSADGNTLLQTISGVTMDASGNFNAAHSQAAGTYDIYVKADHWLRKLANDVALSPLGSIGSISLINGDVDGDNEVGPGDFGQLATAFLSVDGDPNWNANADLDGDGEVGPGDFGILANNFLTSGD